MGSSSTHAHHGAIRKPSVDGVVQDMCLVYVPQERWEACFFLCVLEAILVGGMLFG
jgi:hypothetical protein